MKRAVGLLPVIYLLLLIPQAGASIIYVDDDADTGGNGETWASAYACLQDALGAAQPGDTICVAQGAYKPDRDADHPTGSHDRLATFQLEEGTALLSQPKTNWRQHLAVVFAKDPD